MARQRQQRSSTGAKVGENPVDVDTGLPVPFIARLVELVPPAHLAAVLASFAADKPLCVRANTLRAAPAAMAAALADLTGEVPEPVPGIPGSWFLPAASRSAITGSSLFTDGGIYVQNPASLVPPLVLDPQPGMEVLDLAAAPGGKSVHLAQLMQNQGRLACVEAVRNRFFRLRANLERCGVTIADTYLKDGRQVGRQVPARFDRVLLDAPCSSEARFRAGQPDSWQHWSPRKVKDCARKQKGLLLSALAALKPGGRLVYCTCSFAVEENEQVVAWALAQFPGSLRLLPVTPPAVLAADPGVTSGQKKVLPDELEGMCRLRPDQRSDALVLCLIERLD